MHLFSLTPSRVQHSCSRQLHVPPQSVLSLLQREFARQVAEVEAEVAEATKASSPSRPWLRQSETEEALTLTAALPGLTPEGLELTVEGNRLTIVAKRPVAVPEGYRALHRERSDLHFEQSLRVPASVDTAAISAQLDRGLLTVTLPKLPTAKPRRIPVNLKPESPVTPS